MTRSVGSTHMKINSWLFSAFMVQQVVCAPVLAQERAWSIDSEKSKIDFFVMRDGRLDVVGTFGGIKGQIVFSPKNIKNASVSAAIPINTIQSGISTRDTDLISPNYFDVVRFPLATFKSKRVEKINAKEYKISGDFQLHGITKSIILTMKEPVITAAGSNGELLKATGLATIDQRDYGLSLKLLHPDGFVVINDQIRIRVKLDATSAR